MALPGFTAICPDAARIGGRAAVSVAATKATTKTTTTKTVG